MTNKQSLILVIIDESFTYHDYRVEQLFCMKTWGLTCSPALRELPHTKALFIQVGGRILARWRSARYDGTTRERAGWGEWSAWAVTAGYECGGRQINQLIL